MNCHPGHTATLYNYMMVWVCEDGDGESVGVRI